MKRNVLKTAVIGPTFAGKTALCQALTNRTIDREFTSTIGVDYMVTYKRNGEIDLSLWDLSGLERFESIIGTFIRVSTVLVFCYSAESIESYWKMIKKYDMWKNRKYTKNKRIIIVATKIDSKYASHDYDQWPQTFLKETGYPFIKTSAIENIGIKELNDECVGDDEPDVLTTINLKSYSTIKNKVKYSCCLF